MMPVENWDGAGIRFDVERPRAQASVGVELEG